MLHEVDATNTVVLFSWQAVVKPCKCVDEGVTWYGKVHHRFLQLIQLSLHAFPTLVALQQSTARPAVHWDVHSRGDEERQLR